jgi:hypothetical protein
MQFGADFNVSRELLANISLDAFLTLRVGGIVKPDIGVWLHTQAKEGLLAQKITSMIELPPLLTQVSDMQLFLYPNTQPNFIGTGRVLAELVNLADIKCSPLESPLNLTGKIAMIPQADPGFDWVFGQNISGLITMYGGANSHMAIRAAEFGLPAAIGIGETEYQRLINSTVLELDAGNRQIRVIGK